MKLLCVFILVFICSIVSAQEGGRLINPDLIAPIILPTFPNLHYAPDNRGEVEQQTKISAALDVLFQSNLKLCTTCDSLKFFAIKYGPNSNPTLSYLTVAPSCTGTVNFQSPSGPSGRPGNNQQFIATQIQDETWLLQPRNCPGNYIKAASATSIIVQNGLSNNARFWIEFHDNHVHMQSGAFPSSYWGGTNPLAQGPGAEHYMVEFWPSRAWP